jgi:glyoxylase-like metal-dependent hydrolase (beta-lactamase superfamily II)
VLIVTILQRFYAASGDSPARERPVPVVALPAPQRRNLAPSVPDAITRVGGWQPRLVEVGAFRLPGDLLAPTGLYAEWLAPMNVLLLESGGGRIVLVDAGPGITSSSWPFAGQADTPGKLAELGVAPADVATVILTHLDADHAGGLLDGSWPDGLGLVFPRAEVVVHEEAVAAANAGDPAAGRLAGPLVAVLEEAGRLRTAADGAEVERDIRVDRLPGHRPGHMGVTIDDADPLMHLADTFHHPVHVEHPEWDSFADHDPELALRTRRRVIAGLARSGARVVLAHIPGPEASRITEVDGRYTLVPAD